MRKKGFTLIELLVVIAIIAMLLAILMPALNKVKKIAQRVVCGTNLKGLGTAQTVYANDYDDEYAVQGQSGKHEWYWITGAFDDTAKNWNSAATGKITIGASLYLLVREADVSPKSFVCPSGNETEYDGKNSMNLDIVQLWDFGNEYKAPGSGYPYQHVSYSYHMPYANGGGKSSLSANGSRSAAFAVMADKNPYFDPKNVEIGSVTQDNFMDHVGPVGAYWDTTTGISESDYRVKRANSASHAKEGQNVLFADGHNAYENTTDVGIKNDQIYVPRPTGALTELQIRQGNVTIMGSGTSPAAGHNAAIQPQGVEDSYLVNDDDMKDKPKKTS